MWSRNIVKMKVISVIFLSALYSYCMAIECPGFNLDIDAVTDWLDFKTKYSRCYFFLDECRRMQIFLENRDYVLENNKHCDNEDCLLLQLNEYADYTDEESVTYLTGLKRLSRQEREATFEPIEGRVTLPNALDWRKQNYVTPVQNQGPCSCCYSFVATGAMEGQVARKTGTLYKLSEQSGLDCTRPYKSLGCSGGYIESVYNFTQDTGGHALASEYPYVAVEEPCKDVSQMTKVGNVVGYKSITPGNEAALKYNVATFGPVAAGINAALKSFRFYSSGVYDVTGCSKTDLTHGVLIIGYDTTTTGKDFWIVKNSWGTEWGMSGYMRIVREKNMCGICNYANRPILG